MSQTCVCADRTKVEFDIYTIRTLFFIWPEMSKSHLSKLSFNKIKAQQNFYLTEQCEMCTNTSCLCENVLQLDINVEEWIKNISATIRKNSTYGKVSWFEAMNNGYTAHYPQNITVLHKQKTR